MDLRKNLCFDHTTVYTEFLIYLITKFITLPPNLKKNRNALCILSTILKNLIKTLNHYINFLKIYSKNTSIKLYYIGYI